MLGLERLERGKEEREGIIQMKWRNIGPGDLRCYGASLFHWGLRSSGKFLTRWVSVASIFAVVIKDPAANTWDGLGK